MKPIIASRKHIVQIPVDTTMGGTIKNIIFARSKQDFSATVADELQVGANVKAVYIELWGQSDGQNIGSVTITVEKLMGTSALMTTLDSADLHGYLNKNNVLYTTQGLTGENDTNPIPYLRTWLKIPRGKQRMAINERLVLNISSNLGDTIHCGLVIFKSYT